MAQRHRSQESQGYRNSQKKSIKEKSAEFSSVAKLYEKLQNIRESNWAAISTGVRGLGNVTGEAGSVTDGWINQTASEQGEHTNNVQDIIDDHNSLHNEIEGNDLNPKDGKKAKVVTQK